MIEMVPKPYIMRRTCGGYLAVSPKRARFKIGVTADTEAAVEHKFWTTYVRWCEISQTLAAPAKAVHGAKWCGGDQVDANKRAAD